MCLLNFQCCVKEKNNFAAKSASPVNLAPQFQPQSVDDSDFLKVPSATRGN